MQGDLSDVPYRGSTACHNEIYDNWPPFPSSGLDRIAIIYQINNSTLPKAMHNHRLP